MSVQQNMNHRQRLMLRYGTRYAAGDAMRCPDKDISAAPDVVMLR